jgi:hypothetical protein
VWQRGKLAIAPGCDDWTGGGAVGCGLPISIASAAQPVALIKTAAMDFTNINSAPCGLI